MASLAPVAKSLLVCDEVIQDSQSGKVSVLNLLNSVRVPAGSGFPYLLRKLCVFTLWRGGMGAVDVRVDVVDLSRQTVILSTQNSKLNFTSRNQTVYGLFRLQEVLRFPQPGHYLVEVYCENVFVDDHLIQVVGG